MKARLIADAGKQDMVLLYADGTFATANKSLLLKLFSNFNRGDSLFSKGTAGTWQTESCPDMALYPGQTLAYIADNHTLVIADPTPFLSLMNYLDQESGYISTAEYAQKYNKSQEIVKVFCRQGRILGAKKVGRSWVIPADAEYPIDEEFRREGVSGPRPYMRKRTKNKPTQE